MNVLVLRDFANFNSLLKLFFLKGDEGPGTCGIYFVSLLITAGHCIRPVHVMSPAA